MLLLCLKINKTQLNTFNSIYSFSQVILGLLIPIFIKKLDFKSKEELQLMPQTEEEHLENQFLDYEDNDNGNQDAEVGQKHN